MPACIRRDHSPTSLVALVVLNSLAWGCGALNPAFDASQNDASSSSPMGDGGRRTTGGEQSDSERGSGDTGTTLMASTTLDEPTLEDESSSSTSFETSSTGESSGETIEPLCGDGVMEEGESCDDMSPGHLAGHCEQCEYTFRTVFVTEATYGGGIGGVAGADTICQQSAGIAGLHGEFAAWISSSPADAPNVRFEQFEGEYRRVDNEVVAENWDELIELDLLVPIGLSEFGQPVLLESCVDGGCVWTGQQ